jgi:hypothetical protein
VALAFLVGLGTFAVVGVVLDFVDSDLIVAALGVGLVFAARWARAPRSTCIFRLAGRSGFLEA